MYSIHQPDIQNKKKVLLRLLLVMITLGMQSKHNHGHRCNINMLQPTSQIIVIITLVAQVGKTGTVQVSTHRTNLSFSVT